MAKIKNAQTRKRQAPVKENPNGTDGAQQAKSVRPKSSKTKAMPKHGAPSARRMALVKIEPMMSQEMIAVAAYYRAEKRGFFPGGEVEDWLEAEKDIFGYSRRV